MIDRRTQGRALLAAGLGLAATAWVILAAWAASPWARFLAGGDWTTTGLLGAICTALPGGAVLVPALLHAAGWTLMLLAMMLPTALPVLSILERMTARRADGRRLVALAAAGYLAAWAGFGLCAHLADAGLGAVARRSAWLTFNGWAIGAGVFLLAGLFQFTPMKRRCLDRCRSPVGQVMAHWHGRAPAREAWGLGLAHGLFCVGCCWALMLVMFAVGMGNLGWMLLLGLVMAVEKNLPWGRRLTEPVGLGLIALGLAILAPHLPPPLAVG